MTCLKNLADYLKEKARLLITDASILYDQLTIWTIPDNLKKLLIFLRDDDVCLFKQLVELTAIDYPEKEYRFVVVYHLLSYKKNQRIVVKVAINEDQTLPSICKLYKSANWMEREVWDMYGIRFEGHPDLRRLLTDYGFEGHPLRKDFPLTGFVEVHYNQEEKRVKYAPVVLQQDYRNFDFTSPWKGMDTILPGDEKAIKEISEKEQKE